MQAEWTVPLDHPAFAGHFPGQPILPGVVLLDRVLALANGSLGQQCWTILQAKFLRPVGPGAVLTLTLSPTPRGAWGFEVQCNGQSVVTGALEPGLS